MKASERHTPWWRGRRGEWYVAAQGVFMLLVMFGPRLLPVLDRRLPLPDGAAGMVGIAIIVVGILLAIAGALALGRNLTPLPHPIDSATLVEAGAYRYVRHPIYSGICLSATGWALWCDSAVTLGLAVVLFLFFDIKSRREERWLDERFPGYAGYRKRVRKLIPFIY